MCQRDKLIPQVTGFSGPWPAPAKVNLFLHVTGRRDDGYHNLQTIFQFIDIQDELFFRVRDDGDILRIAEVPGVDTGCQLGVETQLEKALPVGGGLGGGSSDAATTLVALNHLWETGLDRPALADLGLRLGADVPVFVHGRAAWGEGVGEKLQPVTLPEPWFLVIEPDVTVSTAGIFSDPELTRGTAPIKIADFLSGRGENDCEPVVRRRYPAVAETLDWLEQHAPARLTGTGACVFAAFAAREQALETFARLPGGWRGFVARGRNSSPLLDLI
jgi:4-diphosphocytidyl-2-C-methyl-D-erythritol kinase